VQSLWWSMQHPKACRRWVVLLQTEEPRQVCRSDMWSTFSMSQCWSMHRRCVLKSIESRWFNLWWQWLQYDKRRLSSWCLQRRKQVCWSDMWSTFSMSQSWSLHRWCVLESIESRWCNLWWQWLKYQKRRLSNWCLQRRKHSKTQSSCFTRCCSTKWEKSWWS